MTSYAQSPARPRRDRRAPRYPRKLTAAFGFALALAGCGGAAPSFADEGFPPPLAEPEPRPESPTSAPVAADPPVATETDAGADDGSGDAAIPSDAP